jgi:hypothetical protein
MKVSELTPEHKAELQKMYKDAGLKGSIHLMSIEKVKEKITKASNIDTENASGNEIDAICNDLIFDVDVFKPVTKTRDDGSTYEAQEPQGLEFKKADLKVELGGKIPCGQSNQHPHNSFIIKIENETFIMSADLAAKIFKVKG